VENKDGSTRFNKAEETARDLIQVGKAFSFQGIEYIAEICTKPKVEGGGGETKTDVYILAKRKDNENKEEIKISYKKPNYNFVENKISPARAKSIHGENWSEIVGSLIGTIRGNFQGEPLIYFKEKGRVEAGSIKIGWRYEMEYKSSRNLKARILQDISKQVWFNEGCEKKYRDALVDGKTVPNSGIPDYCLEKDPNELRSSSDIFDNLMPMKEFASSHSEIDGVFLAQNYRAHKDSQEGDSRDLAVWVDWKVVNEKLDGKIVFDKPLNTKSGDVLRQLKKCFEAMGIPAYPKFNIEMLRGKISPSTKTFG